MTDFCGTCGAYWACDCPRGLRLDADGWESRVVVLPGSDAAVEVGGTQGYLRIPLPPSLMDWAHETAVQQSIMRGQALEAMLDGTFKLAPEGSGLS